jgi:hypothetical protein
MVAQHLQLAIELAIDRNRIDLRSPQVCFARRTPGMEAREQ